ncbi:MAG: hypothetical protein V1903_11305 [Bacteroidota bacterium]
MLPRLSKLFFLVIIIVLTFATGCAADRKAREIIRRADSSCDLAHLGRNKLYYSPSYKRHLGYNLKHIRRNRNSNIKIVKVRHKHN